MTKEKIDTFLEKINEQIDKVGTDEFPINRIRFYEQDGFRRAVRVSEKDDRADFKKSATAS